MPKKYKILNFDFPLFLYRLGQNTSKPGLNVIKYHCVVGKNDLLNFESFKNFQLFWGLQVYSMQPILTAKCAIASFVRKTFRKSFFGGIVLAQSTV